MKRNAGFTLLELLLAVTVLSMIMAIIYLAFASVVEGMEATRTKAAEMRVRQFISYQFSRNLTAAYIDPVRAGDGLYYMEGLNEDGPDGPADSLTFYSTASIMGAGAFPGDIKLVTIEIIGDEDDADDFSLDRTEEKADLPDDSDAPDQKMLQVIETPFSSPDIAADGTYEGLGPAGLSPEEAAESDLVESPSWTVPIRTLDIQYFDGEQWVEEWNSYDYQRLPWCIRIAINFPKTEDVLREEQELGLDPVDDPDMELDIPLATAGIGILSIPSEVRGLDPLTLGGDQGGGRDNDDDNNNGQGGNGSDSGNDGDQGGEGSSGSDGGGDSNTGEGGQDEGSGR